MTWPTLRLTYEVIPHHYSIFITKPVATRLSQNLVHAYHVLSWKCTPFWSCKKRYSKKYGNCARDMHFYLEPPLCNKTTDATRPRTKKVIYYLPDLGARQRYTHCPYQAHTRMGVCTYK